jgi:hypothetical protein
MIKIERHNWIGKPGIELPLIILLPFICCATIFCMPSTLIQNNELPEVAWLFLIVFVDVGHVYSTLYRTYIDKQLVLHNKKLFFGLPFLLLVFSVILHSLNSIWFWRTLAYIAVYHFIRQQYGFLRIYSRKDSTHNFKKRIDSFTIYAVTLLPLMYWHFSGERNFNWFIDGDFLAINQPELLRVSKILFWLTLFFYSLTELHSILKRKSFNFQKNAIIYGTALAWYTGIVYFNSDFVFTLLNIICHGIPYLALIWIHGKKKSSENIPTHKLLKLLYGKFSLILFISPLLFLAWVEEGFWSAFVWKEHEKVFPLFDMLHVDPSKAFLNLIVPLLALPQLFHYVIDGFIWKLKNDKFEWTKIL